jgi:hypothetical protein
MDRGVDTYLLQGLIRQVCSAALLERLKQRLDDRDLLSYNQLMLSK